MVNNITLSSASFFVQAAELFRNVKSAMLKPFELLCDYYSYALERKVGMREALHLTNAQLAFFATFLPADAPLLFRVVCLVWFGLAVRACRRVMK